MARNEMPPYDTLTDAEKRETIIDIGTDRANRYDLCPMAALEKFFGDSYSTPSPAPLSDYFHDLPRKDRAAILRVIGERSDCPNDMVLHGL
jgi:hypothetical protein